MQFKKLSLACLATMAISIPAQATPMPAEMVNNGGFETGDLSGWTMTGRTDHVGVDTNFHGGRYGLNLSAIGADTFLSQLLNTVAGVHYQLSYWMSNDSTSTPNDFSVAIGGNTLFSAISLAAQTFTRYSFDFIGTGHDVLQFAVRHDPSYFHLDDVSVTASGADIPEPGSLALLGIGLTALGLRRHRKS